MTDRIVSRRGPVITAAEADRRHAEATAQGAAICIEAVVPDPGPGIIDGLAPALSGWLGGPAEPEAEAGR